ncbi:hypothetical protein JS485_004970 [Escherichia coli]|nr:hypothetical protein [Escherichia coli]EHC9939291.1 hypothetical protein [Escherichia coli]
MASVSISCPSCSATDGVVFLPPYFQTGVVS